MAKQGKSSKAGRKAKWCEAYKNRGQREINKALRLARHLYPGRHHTDMAAKKRLRELSPLAVRAARQIAAATGAKYACVFDAINEKAAA